MTARLLRPFNIDIAHKPTCKLRSKFTNHKDKTNVTEKHNAIYTAKNHFLIKKKILNLRNYFLKRETDFLNKKNGS